MPPIRTTTHVCHVPALDSVEHLVLATAAALVDTTVTFQVSSDHKTSLETVTKDAWSTTTTHTTALGWLGALRALTAPSALAESWLEAAELTLVTAVRQGTPWFQRWDLFWDFRSRKTIGTNMCVFIINHVAGTFGWIQAKKILSFKPPLWIY